MENPGKNPVLSEFFGVMTGDGCLSNTGKRKGSGNKYWLYICGHKFDDRQHYEYLSKIIEILFNKKVNIGERKKENAIFIRFSDKKIFQRLVELGFPIGKKYSKIDIPNWIASEKENSTSFLRGLFDTDGSFVLSKQHKKIPYYPRIEIATKSLVLAQKVKSLINEFGIGCSLNRKKEYFRLEVAGNANCQNWMTLIGTRNNKHQVKYERYLKEKTFPGGLEPPTS